jgi:hypothetical protein
MNILSRVGNVLVDIMISMLASLENLPKGL